MYMESRKAVLVNLFTEKKWKRRYREWTCGHSVGGREWDDAESSINIYMLSCVRQIAGKEFCATQGAQSGTL